MLELDRRGIPAVAVFSEQFESGVVAWRKLHGFDAGAVYVRHPIQPLNDDEVRGRADEAFDNIVAAITAATA
jgi:hypothetical protein